MNGLSLLPLDTHVLPGWEPVSDPSAWSFWVVLVVIPVGIGLVLALFAAAPDLVRRNRATVLGVTAADEPGTDGDVAPAIAGRVSRELADATSGPSSSAH